MNIQLQPIEKSEEWRTIHNTLGSVHLLQSWEWGELKQKYGWTPFRLAWQDEAGEYRAAAQILQRHFSFPFVGDRYSIMYCPRGPSLNWENEVQRRLVLSDLIRFAQQQKAVFLKIDPEITIREHLEDEIRSTAIGEKITAELKQANWRYSAEQIQFRNTFQLDLEKTEEDLLLAMKQKTRYNIRLAGKRGVTIRSGDRSDLDKMFRAYAETSVRNGFAIRNQKYYEDAWGDFIERRMAHPLLAEVEEQFVAGLIMYVYGETAWYLYGMSTDQHREKMPNYLLQWEAIQLAKQLGCYTYDFWGAPDEIDPKDQMWGVHRFKQGFGADLVFTLGAWDFPCQPVLYKLFSKGLPPILSLMRFLGRRRTRGVLEDASPPPSDR